MPNLKGLSYLFISSCCALSILPNCSVTFSSLTYSDIMLAHVHNEVFILMTMRITFPLARTSSAALRTPSQACLSHGFLALVVETEMMKLGLMLLTMVIMVMVVTMMMMVMVVTMAYQRSLW